MSWKNILKSEIDPIINGALERAEIDIMKFIEGNYRKERPTLRKMREMIKPFLIELLKRDLSRYDFNEGMKNINFDDIYKKHVDGYYEMYKSRIDYQLGLEEGTIEMPYPKNNVSQEDMDRLKRLREKSRRSKEQN